MFDRLSASYGLALSSWRVLLQDKKLIVFPVLSGLACLLVLASFAAPFVARPQWLDFLDPDGNKPVPWWAYVVLFAFYFCNYFVIVFFNAALVSCALLRFNGEEPTLGDGLRAAARRMPQILAWALVSATVGMLLKAVENAHQKLGEIISMVLGTAWTVMTYFVVPVLVVEKLGPFAAVQRSIALLRQTWGEALVGRLGLGLFLFLLFLPVVLLAVAGGLLCTQVPAAGVAVLVLAAVYFVLWLAVSEALKVIFLSAIYNYASRGAAPDGFDGAALAGAFGRK